MGNTSACIERDSESWPEKLRDVPSARAPRLVLLLPISSDTKASADTLALRKHLREVLILALSSEGLQVERHTFGEESKLKGKEAWALCMGIESLCEAADAEGLPKLQQLSWTADGDKSGLMRFYPFSKGFGRSDKIIWEASEVLELLMARASAARLPPGGPGRQGFGKLDSLAQHSSVLSLATHYGAVEAASGLHDPEEAAELLAKWPRTILGAMPVADLVSYFGIHTAQYFQFVHVYACWLCAPALLGAGVYAAQELEWEHSQRLSEAFLIMTAVWSTLFIERWKRLRMGMNRRFGEASREEKVRDPMAPAWFQVGRDQLKEAAQAGAGGTGQRLRSSTSRHLFQLQEEIRESQGAGGATNVLKFLWTVPPFFILAVLVGSVIYLLLLCGELAEKNYENAEKNYENVVLQNSPVVLYIVVAGILEQVYAWSAAFLTEKEDHPTYKAYLNNLTVKSAFFQLANYLGFFFYVAFWQQDIPKLRDQLKAFMGLKQVVGIFKETGVPMAKNWWAMRKARGDKGGKLQSVPGSMTRLAEACETQLQLEATDLGVEYLQLAVLFATTTCFVVAFPLGPLLALIMCSVSLWTDGKKILDVSRRPAPRAMDSEILEAWQTIFETISMASVVCNIALLGISQDSSWTTLQLIILEHCMLLFKSLLAWSIPDEPDWCFHEAALIEELMASDVQPRVSFESSGESPPGSPSGAKPKML